MFSQLRMMCVNYQILIYHFLIRRPSSAAMWSVLMKISKGSSPRNAILISSNTIYAFNYVPARILFLSSLIGREASLNFRRLLLSGPLTIFDMNPVYSPSFWEIPWSKSKYFDSLLYPSVILLKLLRGHCFTFFAKEGTYLNMFNCRWSFGHKKLSSILSSSGTFIKISLFKGINPPKSICYSFCFFKTSFRLFVFFFLGFFWIDKVYELLFML